MHTRMRSLTHRAAIAALLVVLADGSGSAAVKFPKWPASEALRHLPENLREDTRRLGDEVRGRGCPGSVALAALGPSYPGVTIESQPSLYWFTQTDVSADIQIEIEDKASAAPILDITIAGGVGPGIHELSLAEHRVSLDPGVHYEWSVAALCDPQRRAGDMVSAATIIRIVPPPELERRLEDAGLEHRAELLVEHGIWYDALQAVARLIAERPGGDWRAVRARLLDSVGLKQAAAHGG
jgi:hypothetical protein